MAKTIEDFGEQQVATLATSAGNGIVGSIGLFSRLSYHSYLRWIGYTQH
jgi:hypothetical protein